MRFIYFVILMALLAGILAFAIQNSETITVRYFDRAVSCPAAFLIGAVYLVGMLTGWAVVGVFRRSLRGISNPPPR
jgi:uncharacterized integral membrane protein